MWYKFIPVGGKSNSAIPNCATASYTDMGSKRRRSQKANSMVQGSWITSSYWWKLQWCQSQATHCRVVGLHIHPKNNRLWLPFEIKLFNFRDKVIINKLLYKFCGFGMCLKCKLSFSTYAKYVAWQDFKNLCGVWIKLVLMLFLVLQSIMNENIKDYEIQEMN